MDCDELISLFDGLMISGGVLAKCKNNKNYHFVFVRSIKWNEWIKFIVDIFEKYGIYCGISVRKGGKRDVFGKVYNVNDKLFLQTQYHPFFTEQRKRWYSEEGKKIIPNDIRFDELMIANWMMGRGSLKFCDGGYYVWLNTAKFNRDDVEFLRDLFKEKYDLNFRVGKDNILKLYRQGQVYKFCKMIEPYIVGCFKQKIRCLYDDEWIRKWKQK